jgi:hypothetical protein
MAREGTAIYCERCGAVVPITGRSAVARYCSGCQIFVCRDCWNAPALRCLDCADPSAQGRTHGVLAARRILRDLGTVRAELETLNYGGRPGLPPGEVRLQQRLLAIKAADAAAAALMAIEDVRGSPAAALRRDIELERLHVAASVPSETMTWRSRATAVAAALLTARPRIPTQWTAPALALVGAAVGGGLLILMLAVAFSGPPYRTAGPAGPAAVQGPSATPETGVAGGNPSQTPAPTVTAGPIHASFDELIMDRPLPAAWRLTPADGEAVVAPFPNAVDRSLRLSTSSSGRQTTACRATRPAANLRISLDLYTDDPAGAEISIRTVDPSEQVAIVSGPDGGLVANPGANPLPGIALQEGAWMTLSIAADAGAAAQIAIRPRQLGAEATASLPAASNLSAPGTSLCITSPVSPGASLNVDNLSAE